MHCLYFYTYSFTGYAIFSIPQSLQPCTSGYVLIYLKTLRRPSLEWSYAWQPKSLNLLLFSVCGFSLSYCMHIYVSENSVWRLRGACITYLCKHTHSDDLCGTITQPTQYDPIFTFSLNTTHSCQISCRIPKAKFPVETVNSFLFVGSSEIISLGATTSDKLIVHHPMID
jgi:hypothetical protein